MARTTHWSRVGRTAAPPELFAPASGEPPAPTAPIFSTEPVAAVPAITGPGPTVAPEATVGDCCGWCGHEIGPGGWEVAAVPRRTGRRNRRRSTRFHGECWWDVPRDRWIKSG